MRKKLLALLINLVAMGVVLVLIVFLTFKGLDKFTRHGQGITVPEVKGMTVAEAQQVFKRYGLTSVVSDSTYVKEEPAGCILDYTPSQGRRVKEGRIIYLTINTKSIPLRPIPDVADNSSVRQAHARMLAVGFKLTEDEYIPGQKDWVYEVKYKGMTMPTGSQAPDGAVLTLVVGDGTSEDDIVDSLHIELDLKTPELEKSSTEEGWFD